MCRQCQGKIHNSSAGVLTFTSLPFPVLEATSACFGGASVLSALTLCRDGQDVLQQGHHCCNPAGVETPHKWRSMVFAELARAVCQDQLTVWNTRGSVGLGWLHTVLCEPVTAKCPLRGE